MKPTISGKVINVTPILGAFPVGGGTLTFLIRLDNGEKRNVKITYGEFITKAPTLPFILKEDLNKLSAGTAVSFQDRLNTRVEFLLDENQVIRGLDVLTASSIASVKQKNDPIKSAATANDKPIFTPIRVPYLPTSDTFRLGYAVIPIVPSFISTVRNTDHNGEVDVLRGKSFIPSTGHSIETYTINYRAHTPNEIFTGIKDVLDQIILTPFITAEGGPFGALGEVGDIPTHALAVDSFHLSTVPGLPGALEITIQAQPFFWDWYTPPTDDEEFPREHMDDMICWPLVKTWCRAKSRSFYDAKPLNGKFTLSFPSFKTSEKITSIYLSKDASPNQDINAMLGLKNLLDGKTVGLHTRNVKQIISTDSKKPKVYAIHLTDKVNFDIFTSSLYSIGEASFVGLVKWDKLRAWNYVDDKGHLLPQSGQILEGNLAPPNTLGSPAKANTTNSLNFLDEVRGADLSKIEPKDYAIILEVKDSSVAKSLVADLDRRIGTASSSYKRDPAQKRAVQEINTSDAKKVVFSTASSANATIGDHTDIIIESIVASKYHTLSSSFCQLASLPIHQHTGTQATTFQVSGKCFGYVAKQILIDMKEEYDKRAISKKSEEYNPNQENYESTGAFLHIENEIFQLMGVDFVCPITLQFENVEGQPGVWKFEIAFIEFDPSLKKAEQVNFLPTSLDALGKVANYGWTGNRTLTPLIDRGKEWFSLQASLAQEEVYPDMHLPAIGEFEYWMRCMVKGAKATIGQRKNEPPIPITPDEQTLLDNIPEYVNNPAIASMMVEWPVWDITVDEESAYVEPDFYCYYTNQDKFATIFDTVARRSLGKRKENGAAEGVTTAYSGVDDMDQEGAINLRKHSLDTNIYVVNPQDNMAGNAEFTQRTMELLLEGLDKTVFPGDTAKKMIDVGREAKRVFTNETQGRWWENIDVASPNGEILKVNADYSNIFQGPDALIPQKDAPTTDKFGTAQNSKYVDAPANKKPFYTLKWRQEKVAEVLRYLGNVEPHEVGTNSTAGWDPPFLKLITTSIGPSKDALKDQDLDKYVKDQFVKWQAEIPNWKKGQDREYLARVFLINSYVKVYSENDDLRAKIMAKGWRQFSNIEESVENNIQYITAVGAKYDVDPLVILAFFTRHSMLGTRTGAQNFGEKGWGLLREDLNIPDTAEWHIDTFAKYLHNNLKRWGGSTSLALIATRLQLTADGTKRGVVNGKLPDEVIASFDKAYQDILRSGLGKDNITTTNAIIRKYDPNQLIDGVWGTWVQLARKFGAVNYSSHKQFGNNSLSYNDQDQYFNPYHPLLLVDKVAEAMSTDLSPSGATRKVYMTRNSFDGLLADLKNFGGKAPQTEAQEANTVNKIRISQDPKVEDAVYSMMEDLREYSPFGRLVGAYPSYQILFINEGFYWNGGEQKLWDQFYSRTAVSHIEVFKSRKTPAHSCSVVFSNVFHQITAHNMMEVIAQKMAKKASDRAAKALSAPGFLSAISETWSYFITKNVTEDIARVWHDNHLARIALHAGIRLQVRLGYGSNAARLPVVFNGTIASVETSDDSVSVVATGDGQELQRMPSGSQLDAHHSYAYVDQGGIFAGSAKPVSNIVTEVLIGDNLAGVLTSGKFRKWENANSTHFGDVFYDAAFHSNTSEFALNIYNASDKKLEQNVPYFRNYFNINALWNHDHEVGLAVNVSEPTTWKVIEVCRRACNDFIASAEPFGNRSTLFFGKWWWPFHYAYDSNILDLAAANDRINTTADSVENKAANPSDKTQESSKRAETVLAKYKAENAYSNKVDAAGNKLILDIGLGDFIPGIQQYKWLSRLVGFGFKVHADDMRPNSEETARKILEARGLNGNPTGDIDLTQYCRYKTYTQAYIVHSGINLMTSAIYATGDEGLYTDAVGQNIFNGFLSRDSVVRTLTYSVDSDIQPADRKTVQVDTGLMVSGIMNVSYDVLHDTLGRFSPNATINSLPSTPAVRNGVVSVLNESVKDMYQGWMLLQGQPTIKPRDIVMYVDMKNGLKGPLFVKEVYHTLSRSMGLKTSICPDLVVMPHTSVIGQNLVVAGVVSTLSKLASFVFFRSVLSGIYAMFLGKALKNASLRNGAHIEAFNEIKSYLAANPTPVGEGKPKLKLKESILNEFIKDSRNITNGLTPGIGYRNELPLEVRQNISRLINEEAGRSIAQKDAAKLEGQIAGVLEGWISKIPEDDVVKLNEAARAIGVNPTKLISENPLEYRMQVFEKSLEGELQTMLKDVDHLKAQKGFEGFDLMNQKEREVAIQRFKDEKTIKFVKANAEEFSKLKLASIEKDLKALNLSAKELDALKVALRESYLSGTIVKDADKVLSESVLKAIRGLNISAEEKALMISRLLGSNIKPVFLSSAPTGFKEGVLARLRLYRRGTTQAANSLSSAARIALGIGSKPYAERVATGWTKLRGFWDLVRQPDTRTAWWAKTKESLLITDAAKEELKAIKTGSLLKENAHELKKVVGFGNKLRDIAKGTKGGISLSKYALGAAGGPAGLAIAFAWGVVQFVLFDSTISAFNEMMGARQCLTLMPLVSINGTAYVAGIRGHQGSVISDEPSAFDTMMTTWLSPAGKPFLNLFGYNVLGLVAGAFGIEAPDYGMTDLGTQWKAILDEKYSSDNITYPDASKTIPTQSTGNKASGATTNSSSSSNDTTTTDGIFDWIIDTNKIDLNKTPPLSMNVPNKSPEVYKKTNERRIDAQISALGLDLTQSYNPVASSTEDYQRALGDIGAAVGSNFNPILLGKGTFAKDKDIINALRKMADKYQVPLKTIYQLIAGESGFNPANKTGSYWGLFQVDSRELKSWGSNTIDYMYGANSGDYAKKKACILRQIAVADRRFESVSGGRLLNHRERNRPYELYLATAAPAYIHQPESVKITQYYKGSDAWKNNKEWRVGDTKAERAVSAFITVRSIMAYAARQSATPLW